MGLGELTARLREGGHNEMEALVGTIAETLLEQGEARGLRRGLAAGKAEGKAEALLRLARGRFGAVPEGRAEQVLSADAETLDRWLDALAAAGTLEEVFGGRRH